MKFIPKFYYPLLISLFALLPIKVLAESNATHLIIQFHNGKQVQYALSGQPEISFADDNMEIITSYATFTHPIVNINQFSYATSGGAAVANISTDKPSCYITQDCIVISSSKDSAVDIYNISGFHLLSFRKSTDNLVIPISDFVAGVYLIKIDDVTFRIAKK